jgi:hypothetical protein
MKRENVGEYAHKAIAEELKCANEKHGLFNSNHEAWAVLLEEIQELTDEHTGYAKLCNDTMQKLWKHVKSDRLTKQIGEDLLIDIKFATLEVLFEAIQVCAMCDKWIDRLEEGDK